uniref:Orexin 2 n=1 Tax=Ophionotus victoriae TaxID=667017 RepID=A0A220W0D7_9ECHI|nr:orexin 2 precursor [Ophionotus victoriae]
MPQTGPFLSLIVFTILLYLTGLLAQKQSCCRVKGCSIPPDCDCPLKQELCKDVTKGILSMGKRTRSYEENVYRQLDQNKDRQHQGTRTSSKVMNTILKLLQSQEQEDEPQDWKPMLSRNLWENEDFNEDLYDQQPNFYAD